MLSVFTYTDYREDPKIIEHSTKVFENNLFIFKKSFLSLTSERIFFTTSGACPAVLGCSTNYSSSALHACMYGPIASYMVTKICNCGAELYQSP